MKNKSNPLLLELAGLSFKITTKEQAAEMHPAMREFLGILG